MKTVVQRCRSLLCWHPGWFALAAAAALTAIGIEVIATADEAHAAKQKFWIVLSVAAFVACLLPTSRQVGRAAYVLFAVMLLLLVLMVAPGVPRMIVHVRNGARSWINLGVMNLQPSELTKIAVVLALAWYLRYRDSYRSVRGLLVPFGIVFVPVMLILKQPDLGTAILFGPALFAMLVAAGAKLRHLAAVLMLTAVAAALNVAVVYAMPESMQILKAHQRTRIKAMISRARDERRYDHSINYQQVKAITLIGSGRVRGYGQARSKGVVRANSLPYDYNDMIFAVVVNRWGLLGGGGVLCLFGVLVLSILSIASRAKEPFVRLVAVGFASLLFTQAAINVAITLGLLPVTGITLPFVSYGGSSLLTTFAMLGLVINFGAYRPLLLAWPSFEHDRFDLPAPT